ncbi:grasp-with-spasm system SPASM domain peptide maturase [Polaribacter sp. IC073]|uniref:grasp-with-spasm system SPASM domain peptide maturase n=1 Tax=Polaribacter sp. IC073 TaxID=2508540 RepID=UPI0011BF1462|nr:grasp-with-spasm system SPASM domain peptide maturase [Polaribacter sp. IC073]TXD49765.1 grasp-with-spasm system SPASM domain peptide maturase [Polaribacter sp. IC073]
MFARKGAKRSTICDLQRNEVKLIPNDLVEILLNYEGKKINEIKKLYNNEYDSTIEEYFEFLLENEFIFFTDNPESFPKLDLKWDNSSAITNAIIDRDSKSDYDIINVINQLEELNCKHIEIRLYDSVELNEITDILKYLDETESTIISVDFTLPFSNSFTNLEQIISKYKRLTSLKIFSSLEEKFIPPINGNMGYIIYTKKEIKDNSCCGVISKDFFVVNMSLFTESKNNNSCLNRKIGIDVEGNIKNCPSMNQVFGNLSKDSLKKSIHKDKFKKYWNITKDDIKVCRDCEFKYICTDCRVFVKNKDNIYPKPLKCGYNPYTNKWEEWSKNDLINI